MIVTRRIALCVLAGCGLGPACSESSLPALDDGGGDVRADETAPGDADAEAGEAEADGEIDNGCRGNCANDPIDGPVGRPCVHPTDCSTGSCIVETRDDFDGETYLAFRGGYCVVDGGCDPAESDACGTGATCVNGECRDACARASGGGAPWNDNCDCRDGYECDLVAGACLPGCSNDRECCEVWEDDGDGRRQTGEVTRLPATECADICDPCTFSCVRNGCPGGDCRVGDSCEHAADCPANGACVEGPLDGEWTCTIDACDLDGRECPVGSGCGDLGSPERPSHRCVVPCAAGTEPGSPGYPCRDGGEPGVPDEGDQACRPVAADFWHDDTAESGYCSSHANFADGTGAIGAECSVNDDCASPLGLGSCVSLGLAPPFFCTAFCNAAVARDGSCGEADGTTGVATGVCLSGLCFASCVVPGGTPGSNGCPQAGLACYGVAPFGTDVTFAVSATAPVGLCFTACVDDLWCAEVWGRGTCNSATGVCAL